MNQFKFSKKSLDNLKGVHPDLIAVCCAAIRRSEIDFLVAEGVRTLERQNQLFNEGRTKTLNSRHLTGHAVDIYPLRGGALSHKPEDYEAVVDAMREAAKLLGVPLRWGGDWKTFIDKPHWEMVENG
jgi:peptidoglycan L-alanyl-D-glutamate endopeptidase CwlK